MNRRPDGRWEKVITINGKRKHFYSTATTERKAEKDFAIQLLNYKETEEKGKKLSDVAYEWLGKKESTIAHTTYVRYSCYVRQLVKYFSDTYIRQITVSDLDSALCDMSDKQYGTKTITDFRSVMLSVFKYARKKQYITDNVADLTEPVKGIPPKIRQPLPDDIDLSRYLTCTFGFFVYFLAYTGLRKGEALALQWTDIDFDNKIINISKSVYYVSNSPHIKEPKTSNSVRTVVLLDIVADKLQNLKRKPDDYVFNKNGKILDKSYFTRQWEKFKKESGLDITAHQLRHTYATLLFEMGISEKDAQELMGHSSITITHNIYTHIRQKHKTALAEKMNAYINQK